MVVAPGAPVVVAAAVGVTATTNGGHTGTFVVAAAAFAVAAATGVWEGTTEVLFSD